ncbi:MAG: DUF427 domain-containing protein [Chloroflexi bacterium]|nr:DUF427 domain-containing protein [Chloroflexota bacterium]
MTATQTSIRVEPSAKWVRGYLDAEPVVDSKRVLVVYGLKRTPLYFFPRDDVRLNLTAGGCKDDLQYWNSDGVQDIAFSFADAPERELEDYVAFDWKKLDSWYEEDEEVFVHPRDAHHRVDVLNSSRHVQIVIDGHVVADSHRPRLLFETGIRTRYYLPKLDVRMDLLEPTEMHSACPYKGNAVYWSARIGERVYRDVVWSYPFPTPESAKIQNLLSFYDEKVDVYVDGELQPR